MAREMSPGYFKAAAEKYPDIDKRFLFLTDGHNFRNTELGAVLGLSQLKRLDDSIAIRRRNFESFVNALSDFEDFFYVPKYTSTNSSFCLPLVCKNPELMHRLKKAFDEAGIEHRPIVGGNLLRQPFLAKYKHIKAPNADILNDCGVYVGNSQFVTFDMVYKLIDIVHKTVNEADS